MILGLFFLNRRKRKYAIPRPMRTTGTLTPIMIWVVLFLELGDALVGCGNSVEVDDKEDKVVNGETVDEVVVLSS